ncbi:hypothetical protein AAZX31_20G152100 [Glycine max]
MNISRPPKKPAGMGIHMAIPQTVLQLCDQFGFFVRGRTNRRLKHLLWHAACWCSGTPGTASSFYTNSLIVSRFWKN